MKLEMELTREELIALVAGLVKGANALADENNEMAVKVTAVFDRVAECIFDHYGEVK